MNLCSSWPAWPRAPRDHIICGGCLRVVTPAELGPATPIMRCEVCLGGYSLCWGCCTGADSEEYDAYTEGLVTIVGVDYDDSDDEW